MIRNALFLFTPENSSVFDEVFFEEHGTPLKRNRDQELQKYMCSLQDSADQIAAYLGMSSSPNPTILAVPRPPRRKVGRNAPCPCGSGRKYKRCCGG